MSRTHVLIGAVLCLTIAADVALAQGFYVTLNGGYGLGSGTQFLGTKEIFTPTVPSPSTSREGVFGSFGEGARFGASGGYMFARNFGAELGLSYLLGRSFEVSYYTSATDYNNLKRSGWGFVAVPSVVISANPNTITPYGRFGVALGIMRVKEEYQFKTSSYFAELTHEESGGLAIGFAGALGIVIQTGSALDLFAEASLSSLTYSPTKDELTKYTLNGADMLAANTNRVTDFKESYTTNTVSPTAVSLAVRRPFSSIGIIIGVRVSL